MLNPPTLRARDALALVRSLQTRLVGRLTDVGPASRSTFSTVSWSRDGGVHGGGDRLANDGDATFDRASVNVSCVYYGAEPGRQIRSATALSAIVHPRHPRAPSLHLHTSLTEPRNGPGTWRIMADLNPATPIAADAAVFQSALAAAAPEVAEHAFAQGDRYFAIPALNRHRGVIHFYVEGLVDAPEAEALAGAVAVAAIDTYAALAAVRGAEPASADEQAAQLAYHTLYVLQVLTLDRGTTSGLLVHDQNDAGILGSLPSRVDPALLASWRPNLPVIQRPWLDTIAGILGAGTIGPDEKLALAAASRRHYTENPGALDLQAPVGLPPS